MLPDALVKVLFTLGVFTVSFDILFVVNIGPNIRASQLIFCLLICNYFITLLHKRTAVPVGSMSLLLWTFFIILFIPNSGFIPKGIGYGMWLIFNILIIFTLVQVISVPRYLKFYVSIYVYSFAFVAFFGLMQFFGGVLGFGRHLLVETWWIPDILPRVNGFSYEPSFFASYILIGWVMVVYFLKNQIYIIAVKKLRICYLVITAALLLSGSRLGLIFIFLWYLQYPATSVLRLLTSRYRRKDIAVIILSLAIAGFAIFAYYSVENSVLFQALAFGVGLGGASSHSVDERLVGFLSLVEIFMDSPFIGYSLGGLSYALGNLSGVNVTDFITAKLEGNGVFLEVLAASGIFGFISFCIYIFKICKSPFSLANKLSNIEMSGLLRGMALALLFELAILQPNQNILRPYLWLHIAMLSAVYSMAIKMKRAEIQLERLR
jgi:hypothetical protein